jgi:glycine cleavage system protein P-like pyridoxal-binding family
MRIFCTVKTLAQPVHLAYTTGDICHYTPDKALMIEPPETESKQTLDAFAEAMLKIAQEAREDPQLLKEAPRHAPTRRLDEVRAAKQLILCVPLPQL